MMKVHPITGDNTNKNTVSPKINKIFDRLDVFGAPVPSFTLKGRSHQGTSIGCVVTILFAVLVISFSTFKFIRLMTHSNPQLSESRFTENFEDNVTLNINGTVAFGMQGFYDSENKNDSTFLTW